MTRVYYDAAGQPSPLPVGPASARRHRTTRYNADPCPVCRNKTFYTRNGKCTRCAYNDSSDLFYYAKGDMYFLEFPKSSTHDFDSCTMYPTTEKPGVINCRDVTLEYRLRVISLRGLLPDKPTFSPDDARKAGVEIWVSSLPCYKAGHVGLKTISGDCYLCEQERLTASPRKSAMAAGKNKYTPTEPCERCGNTADRSVYNGACAGCAAIKAESPRQVAIRAGKRYYTPLEPCGRCGTTADRAVSNGVCKGCAPDKYESPRQLAIRAGHTHYVPLEPCKVCNTRSERSVQSGACKGCRPVKADARKTPDTLMMETAPDMIMDREMAGNLGMKVYRTGEPCTRGHRGFRYVSTGNCIDCLKGVKV